MTKKKIGFTAGSFDLTHAGHYLMFEECRKQCDVLVVALQTDPSVDRPGKNIPVQSLEERQIQLDACRWVDKIVVYNTEKDLVKLLLKINPDVRFLGEDWKGKQFTGDYLPIKIIYNSRKHSYSTTELRNKIFRIEFKKRVLAGKI